jgi:hypothetical protein
MPTSPAVLVQQVLTADTLGLSRRLVQFGLCVALLFGPG